MPNNSIRIAAVGDISSGDHYFSIGHGIGSTLRKSGAQFLLKEIETLFNSSDIIIANLEGALSSYSCKYEDPVEGYVFRGYEELAFGLKAAGVNVSRLCISSSTGAEPIISIILFLLALRKWMISFLLT